MTYDFVNWYRIVFRINSKEGKKEYFFGNLVFGNIDDFYNLELSLRIEKGGGLY